MNGHIVHEAIGITIKHLGKEVDLLEFHEDLSDLYMFIGIPIGISIGISMVNMWLVMVNNG